MKPNRILITDQEEIYRCHGGVSVWVGVGGQPDTDICIGSGLTDQEADDLADKIKDLNPHMGICCL